MLAVGQSLAVRGMYPSKHGLMKYKAVFSEVFLCCILRLHMGKRHATQFR